MVVHYHLVVPGRDNSAAITFAVHLRTMLQKPVLPVYRCWLRSARSAWKHWSGFSNLMEKQILIDVHGNGISSNRSSGNGKALRITITFFVEMRNKIDCIGS